MNLLSQTGLLGDESGTVAFKNGQGEPSPGRRGKKLHIQERGNLRVAGKIQRQPEQDQVKLSRYLKISKSGTRWSKFTGAIVDIQSGSGLIKRCPECNRAPCKRRMRRTGKVEGIYDLRVKAVMDDGEKVQDILMNREVDGSFHRYYP